MTETRKYAGKYETPEALEEGYKNLTSLHGTASNRVKELEAATQVPASYVVPEGVTLNDINSIQAIAKDSGMTQAQFDKYVARAAQDRKAHQDSVEAVKKELGESNLNVLQDHIKNSYPQELQDEILERALLDKSLRETELKRRDAALNSQIPGINRMSIGKEMSQDDYEKIAKDHHANPNDPKKLAAYIQAASQISKQKELAKRAAAA